MGVSQSSEPSFQTTDNGARQTGPEPATSKPKSKLEDLGFLELVAGTNPDVDIVAIHGLDGHRENSWMAANKILWLRDLLSIDLPNARVLTYGYDADTRSGECVSIQTIYRHAEKFIQELSRKRKNAARRPIIFVAHSLGGIILKQALVICHCQSLESKSALRDILVSTHGVMFFGTPHSGTNGVTLLQTLNRLLSVYMKTTDTVLQHLKLNSPELENIQSLYLSASERLKMVCFYEEYRTPIMGGRQELIVPRHSATLAGDRQSVQEGLRADHCQMVKFSSRDQNDYETVLSYLTDWTKEAASAVREKWTIEVARRDAEEGKLPSAPEINLPKPIPPVSRNYIERPEIQLSMTQNLLPSNGNRHQPRCILHGIGGAGKTQLATNWIRGHEKSFERIIVVDATSKRQLEADLQRAIRVVGPEYSNTTWEDAVAYLDGKERGWLLFLDNADSPDLNLGPYLPSSTHGAILITTRNQSCMMYAPDSAIHVGGLAEDEAVNLLHSIANVTPESDEASLEIVRELGTLALAVTQAGAYILRTRRLGNYLATLRSHRDRLLRETTLNSTNYSFSTYAAFDLSFHQLPSKAQQLLKIWAYLHHSSIPMAMFERSSFSDFIAQTVLESCPPPEGDEVVITNLKEILGPAWDEVSFQDLIDSAQRSSFINTLTDDAGNVFYSVHPLLQRYIADSLGDAGHQYTRMAAQIVLGALQHTEESNSWYWQLVPHIDTLPQSVKEANIAHALVFYQVYKSLGDWKASRKLLEFALSQLQAMHDRPHDTLISVMCKLVEATRHCGHLEEAETLAREALDKHIQLLGRRHPDTIVTIGHLAATLQDCGQLEEAERLKREVLDMCIELHGRRHFETLTAMGNLAVTIRHRGQLEEAERLEREVLDVRIEVLGRRHPETVLAMGNFAVTLQNCGQVEEAEKLEREVLDMRIELLGRHHPHTLTAMANLATVLQARGQLEEAERLNREVLDVRIKLLGQRHPDTCSAMGNLAATLSAGSRPQEAAKLGREVLDMRIELLGRRHPNTVVAMGNLASTLHALGQLEEAERLQREVLDVRIELFGRRHPNTVGIRGHLAITLQDRGQLEEAERLKREVLDMCVELHGRRHFETLTAMGNLAITLHHRGQLEEAGRLEREVLDGRIEVFGRRHPETVLAMKNLAFTLHALGQLEEAERLEQEVLIDALLALWQ